MENLTNEQAAAAIAIGAAAIVAGLIVYVLCIIAYWKIFTKAGEKGWKSIIPVYNAYIQFKISWKTMWFWIMLALCVVGSIFTSINPDSYALLAIGAIITIAACVIGIIATYKLSKSFGHGAGFFIGLLFLQIIFIFILAFGSSKYIGPEGKAQGTIAE